MRSAGFLIAYNGVVLIIMIAVYATRNFKRLYYARVWVYTMFLAGLLSELAALVLPWRTV